MAFDPSIPPALLVCVAMGAGACAAERPAPKTEPTRVPDRRVSTTVTPLDGEACRSHTLRMLPTVTERICGRGPRPRCKVSLPIVVRNCLDRPVRFESGRVSFGSVGPVPLSWVASIGWELNSDDDQAIPAHAEWRFAFDSPELSKLGSRVLPVTLNVTPAGAASASEITAPVRIAQGTRGDAIAACRQCDGVLLSDVQRRDYRGPEGLVFQLARAPASARNGELAHAFIGFWHGRNEDGLECICRAHDAGQACTDGDDCEGVCLFDRLERIPPGAITCRGADCVTEPAVTLAIGQCSQYPAILGCAKIIPPKSRQRWPNEAWSGVPAIWCVE